MTEFLDIAVELAKESGRIQLENLGRVHKIEFKGVSNIVTDIDKLCEQLIVDGIQGRFPAHDILAEEGSGHKLKSDYRWIIDPLDGTVNYAHGYLLFTTSIALEYKGEVILGVVYEPNHNELFTAERGKGAFLNGRPIFVSKTTTLRNSLLDTGFAYNVAEGEKQNNINNFANFLLNCRAVRRDGAASVDICYVACGRFDGFWELYLKPWDIAAGQLIAREAGGMVSDFKGGELNVYGKEIIVSNGHIHKEMMGVLNYDSTADKSN